MAKKNFGIPNDILNELFARDKDCVYCHKKMISPYNVQDRKNSVTIEHLSFDGPFRWIDGLQESGGLLVEDIVICCCSCNSSRGAKTLNEWLKSRYCIEKKINADTVAEPVKDYLQRFPHK